MQSIIGKKPCFSWFFWNIVSNLQIFTCILILITYFFFRHLLDLDPVQEDIDAIFQQYFQEQRRILEPLNSPVILLQIQN